MSSIERMDAIASGVIALAVGGAIFVFLTPPFWNAVNEMQQQQETVGTIIKQKSIKVKNRSPRSYVGKSAMVTLYCPTIQFKTDAEESVEFEECSTARYQINQQVPIIYNHEAPTDASISQGGDDLFSWVPVLWMGLPLLMGVLFLVVGFGKLSEGLSN